MSDTTLLFVLTHLFLCVLLDLDNRKVLEIRAALNIDRVTDLLVNKQVIMAAQDEVDSFDILGQLYIVVLHHVSQGYDEVTRFFLT